MGSPERGGSEGCFVGRALVHERPAFEILDPDRDLELIRAARVNVTHALAAPVEVFGEGCGRALIAAFSTPPQQIQRALWVADSYARIIGLLTHYPDALGELSEHSRCDGLTGCLTYDSLRLELAREINRTDRSAITLSCCFIDLDGFKRLNEMHGHLRANEMLAEVGLVLREGVRSCDSVGRYGGDEFVAILPQTGATEAGLLAERLRALIARNHANRFGGMLSASIGVAEWTPGITGRELLARADDAMFTAKALPGGVAAYDEVKAPRATSEGARLR